jgi:hypothetical protein
MKKRYWLWLIIALLLMFGLAAAKLNADILFVDEYYSIRVSGGGWFGPLDMQGIWERTVNFDYGGMGVLYYWLIGAWERLAGVSPFTLRYFSLLAGILAFAMMYQLGRNFLSARVGLYAALILASSALFIDYLHEGRAYTLFVFFSAFAVYSYAQIMWSKPSRWFWYPLLTLSLAALAYTHYVALSMGVILGVIHLFHFKMSRRWWFVVFAMALGGLLYLPWISVTLDVIRRGTEDNWRQSLTMNSWQIIEGLAYSFSNANLALFLLLAFYSLRQWNKKVLSVWIYFLLGLLMVLVVNSFVPFMLHIRYLIFLWPALALIMALGIENSGQFGKSILVFWMVVGLYQTMQGDFISSLHGHVYRAPAAGFNLALETLEQRAEQGDMALFHIIQPGNEHLNYFPLAYYLEFPPLAQLELGYEQFERFDESVANGDNDYLIDVTRVLEPIEAVWAIRNPQVPSTQKTEVVNFVLRSQFLHCESVFEREDMQMALYLRPAEGEGLGSFDNNSLRLFDMGRGYQNAAVSHWVLAWETETLPNDTYSVGLHLFDEAGNFVGQADFPLPNTRPFSCIGASVPLDNLASGTYQVRAIVYNWQTGERLLTGEGDMLVIGTVVVP